MMQRSSEIVILNVGGRRFYTTRSTLESRGQDNFLARLINADAVVKLPNLVDEKGALFIDRNGDKFAFVLDFLRTGKLPVLLPVIVEELEFYGLKDTVFVPHSVNDDWINMMLNKKRSDFRHKNEHLLSSMLESIMNDLNDAVEKGSELCSRPFVESNAWKARGSMTDSYRSLLETFIAILPAECSFDALLLEAKILAKEDFNLTLVSSQRECKLSDGQLKTGTNFGGIRCVVFIWSGHLVKK